jgi:hypothetical protein
MGNKLLCIVHARTCGAIVEIFLILVNEKKNRKLIRVAGFLVLLAWIEFEFQVSGSNLKLDPSFFFTFMCYIKNKIR